MNQTYHIRREAMLKAIGLPSKLPKGFTAVFHDVEVATGWWSDDWPNRPDHCPRTTIVLPIVKVYASGIANRIRAACPKCGKEMRFCGLQQHVDTAICRKETTCQST